MWVARSSLHAWVDNPRKNDGEPVAKVAASIKRFGFASPIIARTNGEVIAGHTRLKAAEVLGLDRVPVRYLDLEPAEAHLLALADNKLNEEAEWHAAAVASLLSDYSLDDAALAGWDSDDLEKLANELGALEPKEVVEDEVPEVPVVPVTKLGNLWLLGEHRVLCGDSTKAEDVARLMGGAVVGCVVTDPPFGMEFVSNYRKDKYKPIAGDATGALLLHACEMRADHSKYVFCRWDNVADVPKPTSVITWVKNNWSMGDLEHAHARQTEVALFYPGPTHAWPDGRPADVVNHARTGNDLHPTEKPVSLLAEIVGWTLGLIADPFLGSGTTLIAAEQLGRKCYGMEISPAYVDVIVKRWENLTGKTATLEAS